MMKFVASLAFVASVLTGFAAPAHAQMAPIQQIGIDNWGQAVCSGPMGPGRCADIMAWMQRGGAFGPAGPAGVPTNIVPQDGQMVAMIAQQCGGNPVCIAGAWGTVEVQRCANGVGVPGGCFGPNGEITKVINRFVPQHLQPNVIMRNIDNDLRNGPGENNELVGRNGFVCENIVSLFSRC